MERIYLVSFSPAARTDAGFTCAIDLGAAVHTVAAGPLAELEQHVRRLARDFGGTCCPFIRLRDRKARKPSGFDALCHRLQIIDA